MSKTRLGSWFSKHKKVIIIIGGTAITVSVAALVYILLRSPKSIEATTTIVKEAPTLLEKGATVTSNGKIIDIDAFFRRLPEGQKPSEAKLREVEKLGLTMPKGMTYVSPFTKGLVH